MPKGHFKNFKSKAGRGRHQRAEGRQNRKMMKQQHREEAKHEAKERPAREAAHGEEQAGILVPMMTLLTLLTGGANAQRNSTLTFRKGQYSTKQCSPIFDLRRDCDQYVGVDADGQVVVGYTVDTRGRVTTERYRDKDGNWQTRTHAPSYVRLNAFDDCAEKFVRQEVKNWYKLRGTGFQLCDLDSPEYKRVRGTGVLEGLAFEPFDCHQAQSNFRVAMKGCHNEADSAVIGAWVYGVGVVGGLIAVGGIAYLGYKFCKDGIECPSFFRRSGSYDMTTRSDNDVEAGRESALTHM